MNTLGSTSSSSGKQKEKQKHYSLLTSKFHDMLLEMAQNYSEENAAKKNKTTIDEMRLGKIWSIKWENDRCEWSHENGWSCIF